MPVMVFFKHQGRLTIAVINRRTNKIDESKDVLGKVTLIREINFAHPHTGHLDILSSLALSNLVHPQKRPITDFDTLHAAWEQIFNIELLNERFYRELANWYFWALPQVSFPADLEPDEEKRNATGLIRLLTRLIFCWFLKEKGLIPEKLFHETDIKGLLRDFDDDSSSYYQAILQNLFFATLNQRMGKDAKGQPYRLFAKDEGFQKNKSTYDVNNLYRYESLFRNPDTALSQFEDIPFLNGGLFECLDRTEDGTDKKRYLDGFSRNSKKRPSVPNRLFFGGEHEEDLSEAYGDNKRKKEKVSGLIRIMNRYKFTIVENTPIDQEIALDPELLGKVFENLLASYNEETKTTARKQTGSFYTPRPIVDYMVDESLKAHLTRVLVEKVRMAETDAKASLDLLFAYTEKEHAFTSSEVNCLIAAIDTLKILDPACGSGAFPMGALHKLVYILAKLDTDNERWKQTQLAKLDSAPMREALEAAFADNNDDYGRKLYLIENCLYGVDIQPIAIQITKLRFFISLVCDQKTNRNKKENHGIRPLPNLETKFVAADSLIGLPELEQMALAPKRAYDIEAEIEVLYHSHFSEQRRDRKLANQRKVKNLRQELAKVLSESLMAPKKAKHVADWDPFDPQSTADFFDPHWMFGRSLAEGFDVIIGNPPYVSVDHYADTQIQNRWQELFTTFSARGDIYCFFYERGASLLRDGGTLIFITSNKWMRAGYGEKLRGFLSSKVNTEAVLDFGMAQNFSAATTYTCITRFTREKPHGAVMSCYATDDTAAISNPAEYFAANAVSQKNLGSEAWVVVSGEKQRIKKLVEDQGVPLEKWLIRINYGAKTSHNEAFIVPKETYRHLIEQDDQSERMLYPILRGQDIGKYGHHWKNLYLIGTFKQFRNTYTIESLPAIYRHLQKYRKELEPRPAGWNPERDGKWGGRNTQPFDYLWYEVFFTPNLEDVKNPKIMYPNMPKFLPFYYDTEGFFCNDKGFTISSETESLHYLVGVLNSSVFRCCFRDNFPELMGNTYEVRKIFFEKIPVKKPTPRQVALFEKLVPAIQFAKRAGEEAPAAFLEDLIDACVMECYFREHMTERNLLFHDVLAPLLADYDPAASKAEQRDFIVGLHSILNAPSHPIRNQLLRLTADSPDLLAIIKKEGKV
jgi:adenine-specific DNA-methyltransferase